MGDGEKEGYLATLAFCAWVGDVVSLACKLELAVWTLLWIFRRGRRPGEIEARASRSAMVVGTSSTVPSGKVSVSLGANSIVTLIPFELLGFQEVEILLSCVHCSWA